MGGMQHRWLFPLLTILLALSLAVAHVPRGDGGRAGSEPVPPEGGRTEDPVRLPSSVVSLGDLGARANPAEPVSPAGGQEWITRGKLALVRGSIRVMLSPEDAREAGDLAQRLAQGDRLRSRYEAGAITEEEYVQQAGELADAPVYEELGIEFVVGSLVAVTAPTIGWGDIHVWVPLNRRGVLRPIVPEGYASVPPVQILDTREGSRSRPMTFTVRPLTPDELSRPAILDATVLDAEGGPIQRAILSLHPIEGTGEEPGEGEPMVTTTNGDGRAFLTRVPPGAWLVRARSARHALSETRIELEPGQTHPLGIRLVEHEVVGPVEGSASSLSGRYRDHTGIRLTSLDDPHLVLEDRVRWERGEEGWSGTFAIEEVPEGEWHLEVRSFDAFPWEPSEATVRPPARGLSFVCRDDRPWADLVFRVRTATTGDPLEHYTVILTLGSFRTQKLTGGGPSSVVARKVLLDEPAEWTLLAPGFQEVSGGLDSFSWEEGEDGERRFAIDLILEEAPLPAPRRGK